MSLSKRQLRDDGCGVEIDGLMTLLEPGLSARDAHRIVVATIPAPVAPIDRFLRAPLPGEALAWDLGRRHGAGAWAFAGRGATARLEAAGSARIDLIREQAERLLGALSEQTESAEAQAPPPAVFGGFAFEPGGAASAPWSAFGDGSFVLPRWVYGRRGDRAFLRLAVRPDDDVRARDRLEGEIATILEALSGDEGSAAAAGPHAPAEQMPPEEWDHLVARALREIQAGSLEKVVLARRARLELASAIDVPAALARLGSAYPECMRFALQRGAEVFLGASPELLLALEGLQLRTEAFGGSIERDPTNDDGRAGELLESSKDRREHAYVVEEIRKALGPIALELRAPPAPGVRTLRDVQHLHTPVSARLRAPMHALSLLARLHPTPAVCGVPREAAAAWIRAHEPAPRGWYAGPVGWFDGRGDGVFAVAIRSAVASGRVAWLYAGAGIVEGSEPAREYAETAVKQTAMLTAFGAAGR